MRPHNLVHSMREDRLSLGQYCTISSPEILEIIGYCGFNHVIIDHMFTGVDWQLTGHMIRAASLFGVCPIVRVQTYAWGSKGSDAHVSSEVARALGIGAGGAMVSIGSLDELEACLGVQRDAHHGRIWISPDVAALESGDHHTKHEDESPFFVVPLIEVPELIDQIDDMVALQGLTCVAVGIHDLCQAVGHPFDVEHAEVWRLIERIQTAARPRGIDVWVNTGYRYSQVDEMVARIGRLWERGIRTMQVQGPETLLQHTLKSIRRGASELIEGRGAIQ